ncbi:MAG TPA: PH domain-containing protein [Candidatus Kapabacteria bacterium]
MTALIALIFVYALIHDQKAAMFIMLICLLAAFFLTPFKYVIDDRKLKIVRPTRSLTYPLASISKVTLISSLSQGPSVRVFGIGGLLGFYGYYWFPGAGVAFVLARNRKNLTLIEFRDRRPIVISPDDSEFLAHLGSISLG